MFIINRTGGGKQSLSRGLKTYLTRAPFGDSWSAVWGWTRARRLQTFNSFEAAISKLLTVKEKGFQHSIVECSSEPADELECNHCKQIQHIANFIEKRKISPFCEKCRVYKRARKCIRIKRVVPFFLPKLQYQPRRRRRLFQIREEAQIARKEYLRKYMHEYMRIYNQRKKNATNKTETETEN